MLPLYIVILVGPLYNVKLVLPLYIVRLVLPCILLGYVITLNSALVNCVLFFGPLLAHFDSRSPRTLTKSDMESA